MKMFFKSKECVIKHLTRPLLGKISSEDRNIVKICNMAKFQKTKTIVDQRIEFTRLFGGMNPLQELIP